MKKLLLLFVAITLSAYCFSQSVEKPANNAADQTINVDELINSLNAQLIVHYENTGLPPSYWQIIYDPDNKVIKMSTYDKSSQALTNTNTVDPKNIRLIMTFEESFRYGIRIYAIGKDIKSESTSGYVGTEDEFSLWMLEGSELEIIKIEQDLIKLFRALGSAVPD